jgi:hypothetical protein
MPIPRSHFKGQWVWLQFSSEDAPAKAYVRKVTMECSNHCYDLTWESGDRELVFLASVFRIWPVHGKKGRVIDFAKRRAKRLRVI